ncbi:hypothetical protein Taro_043250 [Colocasia esculenta]|uniref:Uncharacterized protein n=1 Tax=Colocasia esculenta TaxID=4460 RepID=A0A843WQW9_COLES|nr:hypothetical protein [Colocasia esculenta]
MKLENEQRDKLANAAARRTARRIPPRPTMPKQIITQTVQPETRRLISTEREKRQPKQHRAALGRTSTKSAKSRPGRTSPERSPTKRHATQTTKATQRWPETCWVECTNTFCKRSVDTPLNGVDTTPQSQRSTHSQGRSTLDPAPRTAVFRTRIAGRHNTKAGRHWISSQNSLFQDLGSVSTPSLGQVDTLRKVPNRPPITVEETQLTLRASKKFPGGYKRSSPSSALRVLPEDQFSPIQLPQKVAKIYSSPPSRSFPHLHFDPSKQTQSTPGKSLHQKGQRAILGRTFTRTHNPTNRTTRAIIENTAASRTAEATQAGPERTSTRTTKAPFWENPPERTSQTSSTPQTLRQHDNSRNERGTFLRATLTRTTSNSSGSPHQNIRQPSDAPQPKGQRHSNQKRAQHDPGETSLPPESTEKNSRSTSLELTTSQHQADDNHRQVSQRPTSDATRHTENLLCSLNNVD